MPLTERLLADPAIAGSPLARELAVVMTRPSGRTSAGFPYLEPSAWTRFRDWVPHLLWHGPRVLEAITLVEERACREAAAELELGFVRDAGSVVRQVVLTAAITAPSDLWLLRHVVHALRELGVARRLLDGEAVSSTQPGLIGRELAVDLRFLLARGYLARSGQAYRLATHRHARRLFEETTPVDDGGLRISSRWAEALHGDDVDSAPLLAQARALPTAVATRDSGLWMASPEEVDVGSLLVPLVVALQASGKGAGVLQESVARAQDLCPRAPAAGEVALSILRAAGVVDEQGRLGVVGRRVLERGPGPMGIIEAYQPYLAQLPDILRRGRGAVWVERSANVAASQVANAKSFEKANDALDAFCAQTGFRYDVFIEHALGRGEATRQRFARSGDERVRYVGADLEEAAIDAAVDEQRAGRLPADMRFVRKADIGEPAILLDALSSFGLPAEGAVMLVGNGLHEVRAPDGELADETMTRVLEGYCRAGIVLLFTEESALSVEDLLETAWNTYHAGFKYVHERSGQGLRPAVTRPPSALEEGPSRASWSECAERAGYLRVDAHCVRSRSVYPYPPPSGHNPCISVTHFVVPKALATRLGLALAA